MSPWKKLLLAAVTLSALLVVGTAAAAAYAVHALATRPWVEMRIEEHGVRQHSIRVSLPSALVGAAIAVAPHLMPDDARCDLETELAAHQEWQPLLHQLADELVAIPDATLLEVDDRNQHVRVTKHGAMMRIEIEGDGQNLDLTLPADLVRHAVRTFA